MKQRAAVFTGCYTHSTFIMTEEEVLYAFGDNRCGKLALGDTTNRSKPNRVCFFDNMPVEDVVSGFYHSLFLTRDRKEVFFCSVDSGRNSYSNLFSAASNKRPQKVEGFKGEKIKAIAAGRRNSYCLTESGVLYSFGENENGQLGTGVEHEEGSATPVPVDFPNGVELASISVGGWHVAAVTTQGALYTFGWKIHGQLGREGDPSIPGEVTHLKGKVVKEAMSGALRTVVLVETNEIYAFGYNADGSLGIGTIFNEDHPVRISYFDEKPIKSIRVGGGHTICTTEDGDVVAFGLNSDHQLILGDNKNRITPVVQEDDTFSMILGGRGEIADFVLGNSHTIIVTEDGTCFGIGDEFAFGTERKIDSPQFIMMDVGLDMEM